MKPLAVVPYANNQSVDFYKDRLSFKKWEILYEDINGYSYSLTHTSNSVFYVPVANSTSFGLYINDGTRKIKTLNKSATSGLYIKGKGQITVQTIFSELMRCMNEYVAPTVFKKLVGEITEYGCVEINNLKVYEDCITTKPFFKEKVLSYNDYYRCIINQGWVRIFSTDNKEFGSTPLGAMNAPILPTLLDSLAYWYKEGK